MVALAAGSVAASASGQTSQPSASSRPAASARPAAAKLPAGPLQFDVFILAGQSNMDGRAKAAELTGDLAAYLVPQQDVMIAYPGYNGPDKAPRLMPLSSGLCRGPGKPLDANAATPDFAATSFGPELSFGRTMADGMPGRHVLLIKFAAGGTSLQTKWRVGEASGLYADMIKFTKATLAGVKAKGHSFRLRAFVWHQGESDAKLAKEEYVKLLADLAARLRTDVEDKDLPMVLGEVCSNPEYASIREAQKMAPDSIANTVFVPAADLKTYENVHFNTASQIELGKRLAEATLKKIDEKPKAKTK